MENRIKGQHEDSNIDFTAKGIIQIDKLSNFLQNKNIEAIFTSDLLRTEETSNIINQKLKVPIFYYKNIRGLNMEDFHGKLMKIF